MYEIAILFDFIFEISFFSLSLGNKKADENDFEYMKP